MHTSRLTLRDVSRIIEAIVNDLPYVAVLDVKGTVEHNNAIKAVDITAPTYVVQSILEHYADVVVLSIAVKDTVVNTTGLKIGIDPIDEMHELSDILVRCEMTTKKETKTDMTQTLSDLLRQKFGN